MVDDTLRRNRGLILLRCLFCGFKKKQKEYKFIDNWTKVHIGETQDSGFFWFYGASDIYESPNTATF